MKTKKILFFGLIFGLGLLYLSPATIGAELEPPIDFSLTVNCPVSSQQAALNSLVNGRGFNFVNAALASSLAVVSDSTDYLIGFFVFLLLLAIILIMVNIKRRLTLKHFRILPALAWRRPTESYLQMVIADGEGSWTSSYSRHRFYHQLGATGFWGALTSVAIKLFLIFFLSSAIFQSKASVAQENFVTHCQINSGQTMAYKIILANLGNEPLKVAVAQPLVSGLSKVNSLQSNLGRPELTGNKIALQTEIKSQDKLTISYQATAASAGEIKQLAYALVGVGSKQAMVESGELVLKVKDQPPSARFDQPASGKITNVIGQLTKVQPINQSTVKANFRVSGQGGSLIMLVWQSEPIIQTLAPTDTNWTYETELVLEPGEHSLIVSGKDKNDNFLNQVGPIYFQVPNQPISQPIIFAQSLASQRQFFQPLIDFINDPVIEKINEQVMAPTLLALSLVNAAAAIPPFNFLIFFQYLLINSFIFSRRWLLSWGVVYDSAIKKPIDLAVVKLFSKDFHHLVQTRVTGQSGRYLFVVKKPGKYHLTVSKAGYVFPTKVLKNKKEDGRFYHLYQGQSIVVKSGGKRGLISLNVPLDPIKKSRQSARWHFSNLFHNLVGGLTFVLTTGVFLISPKPLMLALWLFQVILYLLFRRLSY